MGWGRWEKDGKVMESCIDFKQESGMINHTATRKAVQAFGRSLTRLLYNSGRGDKDS